MNGLDRLAEIATAPEVLGALAIAIGYVLSIAGAIKLARPAQAAAAISNFRLTTMPSITAARLAGLVELSLGAGLATCAVALPGARAGALALAAVAFGFFAFLVKRALDGGDRFACACFGGEEPIGPATLARASGLMVASLALAATALASGSGAVAARPETLLVVAACFGVAALARTIPNLWRWNADPLGLRAQPVRALHREGTGR